MRAEEPLNRMEQVVYEAALRFLNQQNLLVQEIEGQKTIIWGASTADRGYSAALFAKHNLLLDFYEHIQKASEDFLKNYDGSFEAFGEKEIKANLDRGMGRALADYAQNWCVHSLKK